MVRFVGLDVHKRVVEACVLDVDGSIIFRHRFPGTREEINGFAATRLNKDDRVVLEASTNTWAVLDILAPYVDEVVVSNPLQTKAIASARVKTDKVDAHVLAQLLRCDFLPRVWQPDGKTRELRRLVSHRASLVAQRTAVKNRLQHILAERLIASPWTDPFGKSGRKWIREQALDANGKMMVEQDLSLVEQFDEEIAKLDQVLNREAYGDSRVKLLITQPGIDVGSAVTLLATLGDISRFKDGDHAASYLGLVPSTKQSAEHCYHGSITKRGNSEARRVLCQAVQHLDRNPGPLGVFFRRIASKKNRNVAAVAAARKLVVIAWHLLKNNEPYRYAEPRRTRVKLRQLRTRAGGERLSSGARPGKNVRRVPLPPGKVALYDPPLAEIYRQEGLPPIREFAPGERKAIKRAAVSTYVRSLQKPRMHLQNKPGISHRIGRPKKER